MMYNLFRNYDERGRLVLRGQRHGTIVGSFLSGRTKHKPIEIISYWLEDEAGRPKQTNSEYVLKYSPEANWRDIKHASVAITAMAVQLCMARMLREQKIAVRGQNGLHGSAVGIRGRRELSWKDISSKTVAETQDILKNHQPLAFRLLCALATPAKRKDDIVNGVIRVRKTRPPMLVRCSAVLGDTACSRNWPGCYRGHQHPELFQDKICSPSAGLAKHLVLRIQCAPRSLRLRQPHRLATKLECHI